MAWIVIEEFTDGGARLVVQSLVDGARYEALEAVDLDASGVHRAAGSQVYADVVHGHDGDISAGTLTNQVRFVNLDDPSEPRFCALDLAGRIQRIRLGPDGHRIALEVQGDGTGTEVRVLVAQQENFSPPFDDLAGICLPDGRSLRRPVFHGDGYRILCVGEDEQRRWQPFLIDLRRPGLETCRPPTARSTAHIEVLPFDASVDPEVDAVFFNNDETAYFSCRVRAGRQRQIHRLHLPTGLTEAIGRVHVRIDALTGIHHDEHLIYGADGAVWLSDGASARPLSHPVPGGEIRGLIPDESGGSLYYVLNGPERAELYELSLTDLRPVLRADLENVTVTKILGIAGATIESTVVSRSALAAVSIFEPSMSGPSDEALEPHSARALLAPDHNDTPAEVASGGRTSSSEMPESSSTHETIPHNPGRGAAEEKPSDDPIGAEERPGQAVSREGDPALSNTQMEPSDTQVAVEPGASDGAVSDIGEASTINPTETQSAPEIDLAERSTHPEAEVPLSLRESPERIDATEHEGMPPGITSSHGEEQMAGEGADDTEIGSPVEAAAAVDTSDVWTTAGAVSSSSQAKETGPTSNVAKPSGAADSSSGHAQPTETSVPKDSSSVDEGAPRPDIDFPGFMAAVDFSSEPINLLAGLKRYVGDATVAFAANDYLEAQAEEFARNPERLSELIFAISAVALVRAKSARPLLLQMCARAYERIEQRGALPEAEEHFAMAGIRAIDTPRGRFSVMAV